MNRPFSRIDLLRGISYQFMLKHWYDYIPCEGNALILREYFQRKKVGVYAQEFGKGIQSV